jgi:hypothetical protein
MKNLAADRKGFLLAEETLKIIIAVICIFFLIYILIAIYNASTSDKKIEQAQAVLFGTEDSKNPGIEKIISSLKDGESQNMDIAEPSGWHLYSFVEQEKPNSCTNEKCLCICQKSLIKQITSQASKCDKSGVCLVVNNLAVTEIDLKIRGASSLLFIEIKKQNGRIFVEEPK